VCLKKNYIPFLAFLFVFVSVTVEAQNSYTPKPYLVAASIYMAVDAQADVWLNGIHIVHCAHTTMADGYKTSEAKPDSLCYFKNSNVLAIKLMGSKRSIDDRFIGVAYAIRFRLSDGTFRVVNSSTAEENRCFYLSRREVEEPEGWQAVGFDDSKWQLAQSSGDMIPNTASLGGGDFGGVAGFLTATNNGYFVQNLGERQLFRRYFSLDISANPRCLSKSTVAPVRPVRFNFESVVNHSTHTLADAQKMSITPVVLPTNQKPLEAAPELGHSGYGTNFALILRPAQIGPTLTPTQITYSPPASLQAQTSNSLAPRYPVVNRPMSTPALVPTVIVQNDGAIIFDQSSANILVTFGDGPGLYQVEAVDRKLVHLKTLLNQRVIIDSETWLTWDGKDDQGNDVPVGRYYIICSKEGTVLQKILLRRVP